MKQIAAFIRRKYSEIYKLILVVLCIFLIVAAFPERGTFKYEFNKGKPWAHENLIAPFDFAINKSDAEINTEQSSILKNSKLYFSVDTTVFDRVIDSYRISFDENWENFKYSGNDILKEQYYNRGLEILKSIYYKGILQRNDVLENRADNFSIIVIKNNVAEEKDIKDFYSILTAFQYIQYCLDTRNTDDYFLSDLLENLIKQNVFYDPATTKKVREAAIESISLSRNMKQQGERIISQGDLVDEDKYNELQSLKLEYLSQIGTKDGLNFVSVGHSILVGLCIAMLGFFMLLFRKEWLADNQKVLFILFSIALVSIMTAVAMRFTITSVYMLPFCILPIIIRAFFDTRLAVFTHLTSTLISGLIVPNPFEFIFIQVMAGIFVIFSIIDLRNRKQLFVSVFIIFIAYIVTFSGILLIQEGTLQNLQMKSFAWFGISALLTLFAYPLIYVYEKMFGFISDVSMMELVDINTPLLRELALKAPGTFQHSLQVANLAEEAIMNIGGSSLLVRAGALYHDIGKMEHPMYFIENQFTGVNPHNDLSYEESADIIINHVSSGVEIAKKHGLPDQVIDFIRTHHGTNRVEYFFRSFVNEHPQEQIDESHFQYPGPLPFSKETAVLMMADAVEATSRSLKKYDSEQIELLVDTVIDKLVQQNQFENSDITFKNIYTLKTIFKKKLLVIYHLRIEYPQLKK